MSEIVGNLKIQNGQYGKQRKQPSLKNNQHPPIDEKINTQAVISGTHPDAPIFMLLLIINGFFPVNANTFTDGNVGTQHRSGSMSLFATNITNDGSTIDIGASQSDSVGVMSAQKSCTTPKLPCVHEINYKQTKTTKKARARIVNNVANEKCSDSFGSKWLATAETLLFRIKCEMPSHFNQLEPTFSACPDLVRTQFFDDTFINQLSLGSASAGGYETATGGKRTSQHAKNKESLKNGINLVNRWVNQEESLTLKKLLNLHQTIKAGYRSAGKFRKVNGGYRFVDFPPKHLIRKSMVDIMNWIDRGCKSWHPIQCYIHVKQFIISLHPFEDGNGRFAQLLSSYVLLRAGYPPIADNYAEMQDYALFTSLAQNGHGEIMKVMHHQYPDLNPRSMGPGIFQDARRGTRTWANKKEQSNYKKDQKLLGEKLVKRAYDKIKNQFEALNHIDSQTKHLDFM